MRRPEPPPVHCDCRAVSVHRAVVIALAVGVAAALLRSLAFRGEPAAQTVCSLLISLAMAAYGVARLFDRDRRLSGAVYVAVVAAGIALSGLWIARLL